MKEEIEELEQKYWDDIEAAVKEIKNTIEELRKMVNWRGSMGTYAEATEIAAVALRIMRYIEAIDALRHLKDGKYSENEEKN